MKRGDNHNQKKQVTGAWYLRASLLGVAAVLLAMTLQVALRSPTALRATDRFLTSFQDVETHIKSHFYLSGNYAPVVEEHQGVNVVDIVQGAIPEDLDGLFIRNGPNPIASQLSKKRHHWFDGHGMLHNLRIQKGSAIYTNMFIPTPRYILERDAGEPIFLRIGELTGVAGLLKILLLGTRLPEVYGLSKFHVGPFEAGPANTHVLLYDKKFYCLNEGSLPFEISLSDLGTIQEAFGHVASFQGSNATELLDYPVSAHPKIDVQTGNLLFHGYSTAPDLVRRDGAIKVGEWSVLSHSLVQYLGLRLPGDDNHSPFAHDMMFTDHWILAVDTSVHFNPNAILDQKAEVFAWNAESNLRIGLVPRITHQQRAPSEQIDIKWIDLGRPYSLVHTLNSWEEEDGTVVFWAPLGTSFEFLVDKKARKNAFYMTEMRMNPETGTVSTTTVGEEYNVEFPRIREDCLGHFCRYGFAGIMGEPDNDDFFVGFVKYDLEKKRVDGAVRYGNGDVGGEPVIIPKPGSRAQASSEVYVGMFVYNTNDQESYFVLFDGETLSEEPVVRLRIPHRVPYGFHGLWVDGADLREHVSSTGSTVVDKE